MTKLSMKVGLLVAVTSPWRVSELAVLLMDSPSLKRFPKRVVLKLSIQLLSKVVFRFHISQEIILPVFLPLLESEIERLKHNLNVKRALLFYWRYKGKRTLSQTLFRRIANTIRECYDHAKLPCPLEVLAHSIRQQYLRLLPWMGLHCQRFVEQWHYALVLHGRRDTEVGKVDLQSLFK